MIKVSQEEFYAMTHPESLKHSDAEMWLLATQLHWRDKANDHIARHEWEEALGCIRKLREIDYLNPWW